MRSTAAYPQIPRRAYLKYVGLCVVAFFLFSFLSDGPGGNETVPGMEASAPPSNLRGP